MNTEDFARAPFDCAGEVWLTSEHYFQAQKFSPEL
jgi:predicted NAD-dependent protein-ADP-ribosyltransferase YbiA (DUF1768 family)